MSFSAFTCTSCIFKISTPVNTKVTDSKSNHFVFTSTRIVLNSTCLKPYILLFKIPGIIKTFRG